MASKNLKPLTNYSLLALVVISLAAIIHAQCLDQDVRIVNTTSGAYQGYSPSSNVHAYEGIPYARSPTGDLRFQPPVPFGGDFMTLQIRDATKPFAGCYQVQYITPISDKVTGYRESEDCLFVNLWAPAAATRDSGLPVVIWLYGGGFVQGYTQPGEGVKFVSEHQDIIFVSFKYVLLSSLSTFLPCPFYPPSNIGSYRTNFFGFPGSDAVDQKNAGFLDQRLAIEWIRDNIEEFGGDNTQMTLLGASAGAMSISAYTYAYPDDPIVRATIHMSGQATSIIPATPDLWNNLLNTTNCLDPSSPSEDDHSSAEAGLSCLQEISARNLRRAMSPRNLLPFDEPAGGVPVVDNITLFTAEEYADMGLSGSFARIPMLAMTTLNEGDSILPFDPVDGVNQSQSELFTALIFHCPTVAETAYRVASGVPTYRTLYSGTFPEIQPFPWARAMHGADVFLFMGAEESKAYEELGLDIQQAGRLLRAGVAAFVRDPDQGLQRELGWPRYDPEGNTSPLSCSWSWMTASLTSWNIEDTLVNLFANNTADFTLDSPREYDAVCTEIESLLGDFAAQRRARSMS